jgi:hypothetical protein
MRTASDGIGKSRLYAWLKPFVSHQSGENQGTISAFRYIDSNYLAALTYLYI